MGNGADRLAGCWFARTCSLYTGCASEGSAPVSSRPEVVAGDVATVLFCSHNQALWEEGFEVDLDKSTSRGQRCCDCLVSTGSLGMVPA